MTLEEMERKLGEVLEFLNQKADLDMQNIVVPENYDYVIESKLPTEEDPTWYRLYKSGWIEQGGISSGDSRTATLTVAMANINYSVICIQRGTTGPTAAEGSPRAGAISTTQIYVNGGAASNDVYWQVSGQSAQ